MTYTVLLAAAEAPTINETIRVVEWGSLIVPFAIIAGTLLTLTITTAGTAFFFLLRRQDSAAVQLQAQMRFVSAWTDSRVDRIETAWRETDRTLTEVTAKLRARGVI